MPALWDTVSWLQPTPLQALIVERWKQHGLAPLLCPEIFAPNKNEFTYPVYHDEKAWMANETRPGAESDEVGGEFEEKTSKAPEWRVHCWITDWEAKWAQIDLGRAKIDACVDKVARRMDERVFTHMGDTTTYTGINTSTKSSAYWDDATLADACTNFLTDIALMKRTIKNAGHYTPDTLCIGPTVEEGLMKNKEILEVISYWTGSNIIAQGLSKAENEGQGLSGAKISGMDIIVVDSTVQQPDDMEEDPILGAADTVYALRRGLLTMGMHTSERVTSELDIRTNRAQKVNVYGTFNAHVFRPKNIYKLINVLT